MPKYAGNLSCTVDKGADGIKDNKNVQVIMNRPDFEGGLSG